jgi:hypothetical protein
MTYRDDRQVLANQVVDLQGELARAQRENAAMRGALLAPQAPGHFMGKELYSYGWRYLDPGQRVAMSGHALTPFPVWAVVVLHYLTFGLFSLFHVLYHHERLPKLSPDDPSGARGAWFMFIPYFNYYWVFFSCLRLCDRINLQYQLRGMEPEVPRGLVLASCIVGVIPYVNFIIAPFIMWPIMAAVYQQAINRLAELGPATVDVMPRAPQLAAPAGWYQQQPAGALGPGPAAPGGYGGYGPR